MQAPALASLASRRFRPYVGTAQGVRRSGCAAFGLPARQVRIAPLKETGRTAGGKPNPRSRTSGSARHLAPLKAVSDRETWAGPLFGPATALRVATVHAASAAKAISAPPLSR